MDTSQQAAVVPKDRDSSVALKRQRRSIAEKRRIVEETLVEGASVARVARAHGVNANQVFYWRKLYQAIRPGDWAPLAQLGCCRFGLRERVLRRPRFRCPNIPLSYRSRSRSLSTPGADAHRRPSYQPRRGTVALEHQLCPAKVSI